MKDLQFNEGSRTWVELCYYCREKVERPVPCPHPCKHHICRGQLPADDAPRPSKLKKIRSHMSLVSDNKTLGRVSNTLGSLRAATKSVFNLPEVPEGPSRLRRPSIFGIPWGRSDDKATPSDFGLAQKAVKPEPVPGVPPEAGKSPALHDAVIASSSTTDQKPFPPASTDTSEYATSLPE